MAPGAQATWGWTASPRRRDKPGPRGARLWRRGRQGADNSGPEIDAGGRIFRKFSKNREAVRSWAAGTVGLFGMGVGGEVAG
jgi:hypothetical protein